MTTQTTTTTSTVSTTTPQQILQNDTLSQSISHYSQPILYARSRNIVFTATGLKPLTKHYSFLDGVPVDQYITSKFIEINMISGIFQVGELVESDPLFTSGRFSCRLCTPNHRNGPYNNPTEIFTSDIVAFPLAQTYGLTQTSYSASSKSLNIDVLSLANPSEVAFSGYTRPRMRLIGRSSGAIAEVVQSILVSDDTGFLTGSFFIPDPSIQTNPKFINGTNTFVLTNIPSAIDTTYLSFASAGYYSNGTTNITDINNITTRNYTIIPARTVNTTTTTNTTQNIITQVNPTPQPVAPIPKTVPTTTTSIRPFFEIYGVSTRVNGRTEGAKSGYFTPDPIVYRLPNGQLETNFVEYGVAYASQYYRKVEAYAQIDGDSTRYLLTSFDIPPSDGPVSGTERDPYRVINGRFTFTLDSKYFEKKFTIFVEATGCERFSSTAFPNLRCGPNNGKYTSIGLFNGPSGIRIVNSTETGSIQI